MPNLLTSTAVLLIAAASIAAQTSRTTTQPDCRPAGDLVRIEQLPEASGVAASRRAPGLFWAHNDSGEPMLFALDQNGATVGRVRVTGAAVDDWEDVAVGPCASGSCIYIADVGDNGGKRDRITVYRVPEPDAKDSATAPAERFDAAYPDGAHDAEALFVTPDARLFIVTKGDPGPVALYTFPQPLKTGGVARLEAVGEPLATAGVEAKDRPTAADVSPDGRSVAVRTLTYVSVYSVRELTAGRWREQARIELAGIGERRGEGVTFTANGDLVLVGEQANLSGRGGTFVRLSCRPSIGDRLQ